MKYIYMITIIVILEYTSVYIYIYYMDRPLFCSTTPSLANGQEFHGVFGEGIFLGAVVPSLWQKGVEQCLPVFGVRSELLDSCKADSQKLLGKT